VPAQNGAPSAFFAFWSLSETPPAEREPWVPVIAAHSHVLIGFQDTFEAADNREWFAELTRRIPERDWQTWPLGHVPGHTYLLGTPRH
jgi:hypothetical protein